MQQFIHNLRAFNRRERFFVVGWALDNPSFSVGEKFRRYVARETRLRVLPDAFCAMDFSIDWIRGCLWLTKEKRATYDMLETGEVNAKNDDVDLLIAYEAKGKTQLLLIEAKGVTGWKNSQLRHKASRLGELFGTGEVADKWPSVEPHWILASAKRSANIDVSEWPLWMKSGNKPRWWLDLPLPTGLQRIERCDEKGRKNANGLFWKVK